MSPAAAARYLEAHPKPKFGDDQAIVARDVLDRHKRVTCRQCSGKVGLSDGPSQCHVCENTGFIWIPR